MAARGNSRRGNDGQVQEAGFDLLQNAATFGQQTAVKRVAARRNAASDAMADVVARQAKQHVGRIASHQLGASGRLDVLVEAAMKQLRL